MFKGLLKKADNALQSSKNKRKMQSFTFYIPSPPERKIGYREKQFDKLFYEFINQGYEILSINTQSNNNPNHSGMWVICIVRALNEKAEKLNLNAFFNEDFVGTTDSSESHGPQVEIDGLYVLDEEGK